MADRAAVVLLNHSSLIDGLGRIGECRQILPAKVSTDGLENFKDNLGSTSSQQIRWCPIPYRPGLKGNRCSVIACYFVMDITLASFVYLSEKTKTYCLQEGLLSSRPIMSIAKNSNGPKVGFSRSFFRLWYRVPWLTQDEKSNEVVYTSLVRWCQ